ncbi:MAG TPA: cysteine hydrolase family protein [Actinopolymorphaceae bacterium]|jgi:nicotinamidase-related amidase
MPEALLIIDMQSGILAEVPDAEALTTRVGELADRARAAGKPVIVIQHEAPDLIPGSAEWKLAEAVAPRDGDILLHKRNCDSFIGTDLDERLRELGVNRVVVTGLATEFCIDSTVRAALSRGYDLTLVEDGHSTPAPPADSGLTAEAIVARYNEVLGWADYPDRNVTVTKAADVTFD